MPFAEGTSPASRRAFWLAATVAEAGLEKTGAFRGSIKECMPRDVNSPTPQAVEQAIFDVDSRRNADSGSDAEPRRLSIWRCAHAVLSGA